MSQKTLKRAHVLERLITDDSFTIAEASEAMGISRRHTIRLKGAYKKTGIDALVHKNIGKTPPHALSEETRQKIVGLKQSELFVNANFAHFKEILEREVFGGIKISYGALHETLRCAGIISPKKRRPAKTHRRRKRKAKEGLLLQTDASPHDWLNIGQQLSLHGAIDDATGRITALYLCKNECLQGYFEIMRTTIQTKGLPCSIYADRHTIFISPKSDKLTIEEELQGIQVKDTQFGRALRQLGITLIKARSPQAKGRIERLWETLQSRLPIEFAIAGIKTIDEANTFLESFVHEYNNLFAVVPEDTISAYRSISPALILENVLCVWEDRKFDNGGVFSFYNKSFKMVVDEQRTQLPHKGNINVLVSPRFGVRVVFAGLHYETIPYVKPEKAQKVKVEKVAGKKYIPPDTHYYKYGHKLQPKILSDERYLEILKMLERIFLWKMDSAI